MVAHCGACCLRCADSDEIRVSLSFGFPLWFADDSLFVVLRFLSFCQPLGDS
jgi:hypothetical protein